MSDLVNSLSLSASAMRAQANRLRHVSENIANAETPGYRRKMVQFQLEDGHLTTGPVQLDQTDLRKTYDPSHPMANEKGYYDGSNVNLLVEIADAREANRSYQANLNMFDQARKMSSSLMELLRR